MTEQLALEDDLAQRPLRSLDACESDLSECRVCGAPPAWRVQIGVQLQDFCDAHVREPAPYGEIPF